LILSDDGIPPRLSFFRLLFNLSPLFLCLIAESGL
jgi:hypothetical protein